MKRLFLAVILVLLCTVCSSCNTKPPVSTTDSSKSEPADLFIQDSNAKYTEVTSLTTEHIFFESQITIPSVEPDEIVLCETPITLIYPRYQWRWR